MSSIGISVDNLARFLEEMLEKYGNDIKLENLASESFEKNSNNMLKKEKAAG
ncbi:hypothetical protein ACMZ6Y_12270 [Streptococcus pluranimalium]|uniref:hypothetical protein n=1 Tax=Streptococcus hyovaginalis TaxID=149015 RepID=UPI002A83EBAD|nr:hypothetical protein [Streptococcus hyovaginalis]MDY4511003.1 hypothetical protein [Streptococcus hyovaginalis]